MFCSEMQIIVVLPVVWVLSIATKRGGTWTRKRRGDGRSVHVPAGIVVRNGDCIPNIA